MTTSHNVKITVDESAKTRKRLSEFWPADQVDDVLPTEAVCSCGQWDAHGEQAGVRALSVNHEAGTDTA